MSALALAQITRVVNFCHEELQKPLSLQEQYNIFLQLENLVDFDKEVSMEALKNPAIIKKLPYLRESYAKFVYKLELQWARDILESSIKLDKLETYPKYQQYRLRAFFEYHLLDVLNPMPRRKILLVGCGPLPLTGMILTNYFKASIDYLDRDVEAIQLTKNLLDRLGLALDSQYFCTDILKFRDFEGYDAICMAASVGGIQEDERKVILQHMSHFMQSKQFLILRPPFLLETLLHSEISNNDLVGFHIYSAQILGEEDIVYRIIARKH